MKITNETTFKYDYFNGTKISFNNMICFYYEDRCSLDKYQIRESTTDRVVVCSENKEDLLKFLIEQKATIIE